MAKVEEDHTGVPLLEMRGIVKVFPGVRALDGVDLQVRAGEVHCLLGQNGAGKSTLIKVLAGAHHVDAGEVLWQGQPASLGSPVAALKQGIATIYQELDLVDWLSVGGEHLPGSRAVPRLASRNARRPVGGLESCWYAWVIRRSRASREVGTLSAAGKQIVSMARALSRDARLIVMDEPSAVLDGEEVENLFTVVADLAAAGVAVVYISHRLEEIRRIGDRITVLKDGRTVATGLDATNDPDVGADQADDRPIHRVRLPAALDHPAADRTSPPLLSVDGLSRRGEFDGVTFDVRPGEIVGLAGLVGAGRSEIVETIFGARGARQRIGAWSTGPRCATDRCAARSAAGVGLCPEERKSQGLILDQAVYQNISMATMRPFRRRRIHPRRRRAVGGDEGRGDGRCPAGRPGPDRAHPVRRQPAEDRAGQVAAAAMPGAAAR